MNDELYREAAEREIARLREQLDEQARELAEANRLRELARKELLAHHEGRMRLREEVEQADAALTAAREALQVCLTAIEEAEDVMMGGGYSVLELDMARQAARRVLGAAGQEPGR